MPRTLLTVLTTLLLTAATALAQTPRYSAEEITNALLTLNVGEVEAAGRALARAEHPQVQAYARTLMEDHRLLNQQLLAFASEAGLDPQQTAASRQLKSLMERHAELLQNPQAGGYDRAFLESQIQIHQQALALISNELLPQADAQALRRLLVGAREIVDGHLALARQTLVELGG